MHMMARLPDQHRGMRRQYCSDSPFGFTLIELLVVIAILCVLAAILLPVFGKVKAKGRQATCIANLRQLTMAAEMFSQENRRWPDADTWVADLAEYANHEAALFNCPADVNGKGFVSYAYNGLLVQPDTHGVAIAAVTQPDKVGLFIDATSAKYPHGPVLNYSAGRVVPITRHSFCIGYQDGHVEVFGQKASLEVNDLQSPYTRGFVVASSFNWINNPGAGAVRPSQGAGDQAAPGEISIGTSPTCLPLLKAASGAWAAGDVETGDTGTEPALAPADAPGWENGDLSVTDDCLASGGTVIATGAAGVIVSAKSALPFTSVTKSELAGIFNQGVWPFAVPAGQKLTIYTLAAASGPARAIQAAMSSDPAALLPFAGGCRTLETSQAVIDAVADDPYAIGLAALSECDPERVSVVGLALSGGVGPTQSYTRSHVERHVADDESGWLLQYPVRARLNNPGNQAAAALYNYITNSSSFQQSLILHTSYYPPVSGYPSLCSNW